MKKNYFGKLFGLTLAAALALTILTACNGASQTSADASDSVSQTMSARGVGTVLLSVNPEIEMSYDKDGNVVALTGLNSDGQSVLSAYDNYEGRSCKAVIGELVSAINAEGYFATATEGQERNIVLKLERGSKYPTEQFLDELADAVRTVTVADQIGAQPIALDDDDYDDTYGDKGYINATAAQNLLSTQLGRSDIQFVEKAYDLDDGEYEVEFVLDGVKYEYEVNARTGKVTEMDASQKSGVTDYNDTDYGANNDGVTDYNDTDYGPSNDGVTDYNDTDYGPSNDGVTDYSASSNGNSDYSASNNGNSNYSNNDDDDDDNDD